MTPLDDTTTKMVYAGLKWLEDHPADGDLSYEHYQPGSTGMFYANNQASALLLNHIIAAVRGDCNGAQIENVILRLGFIHKHGWDAYAERVRTGQSLLEPPPAGDQE